MTNKKYTLASPIEMIALYTKDYIQPLRYRINSEEGRQVINILQVKDKYFEKIAGNPMWVFICSINYNGKIIDVKIKYDILNCYWIMFNPN